MLVGGNRNVFTTTTLCMDIQYFALGYCTAAAPDPARIIGVQIAQLQLKQPNLGQKLTLVKSTTGFFCSIHKHHNTALKHFVLSLISDMDLLTVYQIIVF